MSELEEVILSHVIKKNVEDKWVWNGKATTYIVRKGQMNARNKHSCFSGPFQLPRKYRVQTIEGKPSSQEGAGQGRV